MKIRQLILARVLLDEMLQPGVRPDEYAYIRGVVPVGLTARQGNLDGAERLVWRGIGGQGQRAAVCTEVSIVQEWFVCIAW